MAKILVLTSRFPYPLEKGDKLRIYNQIKELSALHQVHLISINHTAIAEAQKNELAPFCEKINVFVIPVYQRIFNLFRSFFSPLPMQVGLFYKKKIHMQIRSIIKETQPDTIYCHLIRMSEYVKDEKKIRKTLDYMDAFSKGMQRQMNSTSMLFKKIIFYFEYKRLLKYESDIFDHFNEHTIISAQDRHEIHHTNKNNISIIPNGVDRSIFYPMAAEKKYDLLFSGNMGYPPNIDAAYFAATEILPILIKIKPDIKLLIAGVNAPKKLKKLRSMNIDVIEHFDHIRDAFAMCTINLVPVITSIGLQNKILQAMAMKIPTVTTPSGAHGIDAQTDNVLLIGKTPEELALHITLLLKNPGERNRLADAAYEYVQKKFSWQLYSEKLLLILLNGTR